MGLDSKTAVILLGGDVTPTPRLKQSISQKDFIIIAADGGIRHAETLNITPTLWLGDFDSAPKEIDQHHFKGAIETHNPDKAQTDGELAIERARQMGATKLILVGALSGERSDHMLMHMSMALSLAAQGFDILMTSGAEEAIPLIADNSAQTITPHWPEGAIFSLVGYTDLEGVTLKGMKWPLHQHFVPFGDTLTLSNEIRLDENHHRPEITLEKGRAIAMVHTPQNTDINA